MDPLGLTLAAVVGLAIGALGGSIWDGNTLSLTFSHATGAVDVVVRVDPY